MNLLLQEPIFGAYSELFAGLSTDITMKNNGSFGRRSDHTLSWVGTDDIVVEPWGRLCLARKDIELGSKTKEEGGTGIAQQFWDWSEKQVAQYL